MIKNIILEEIMGRSYRRTGDRDFAYCEKNSQKGKHKIKDFTKSFKSVADLEDADDDELEEFFDEPDK